MHDEQHNNATRSAAGQTKPRLKQEKFFLMDTIFSRIEKYTRRLNY